MVKSSGTWSIRKTLYGNILGSDSYSIEYIPLNADEWQHVEVTTINSSYFTPNFRYKFQFEADGGNNIYIDNINIYPASSLGIESQTQANKVTIYPNPAQANVNVEFNQDTDEALIEIYNADGQKVSTVNYQSGVQNSNVSISVQHLAKGLYFIKVSSNQMNTLKKFVKQ